MASMRTIRKRLSSLLAVMLAFQLGGLIAPVALSAAGASVIEACTCPGGTHATTSFDVADEPSAILAAPVSSIRPRADFPDSPPPRS